MHVSSAKGVQYTPAVTVSGKLPLAAGRAGTAVAPAHNHRAMGGHALHGCCSGVARRERAGNPKPPTNTPTRLKTKE